MHPMLALLLGGLLLQFSATYDKSVNTNPDHVGTYDKDGEACREWPVFSTTTCKLVSSALCIPRPTEIKRWRAKLPEDEDRLLCVLIPTYVPKRGSGGSLSLVFDKVFATRQKALKRPLSCTYLFPQRLRPNHCCNNWSMFLWMLRVGTTFS